MKTFRFTTLSGASVSIDLDTRTYDALSHESTRGWGETLDWYERRDYIVHNTKAAFGSIRVSNIIREHTRYTYA